MTLSEIEETVDDLEAVEGSLTSWEIDFVSSIRHYLDTGLALTENQVAKLNEIWEEHC